jgi:hypothetical protein
MNCDPSNIPNSERLFKDGFGVHEVESVFDLMACMQGPLSNSAFRRIVMLMLRGHYSSNANYPEDLAHLRCFTWIPDGTPGMQGTLSVDFTHNFDDKHPDKVPGIFVGFGGANLRKIAIGDHHSHSDDRSQENLARGSKLGIRVHHIAKSLDDAMDLAEMSQLFLLAMSRVVRAATGAEGFEVLGYAEAVKNKLSSLETNYEVVLSVEISYTLAAALSEESHRIRVISGVIGSAT